MTAVETEVGEGDALVWAGERSWESATSEDAFKVFGGGGGTGEGWCGGLVEGWRWGGAKGRVRGVETEKGSKGRWGACAKEEGSWGSARATEPIRAGARED